ncbi:MAG: hypothetical protein ACRENE_12930, partial [Polyangiaceae bacterium]
IATGALRAYLSEGSAMADGKKKNKSKRVPKAPKATRPPGTTSNQQGAVAQGGGPSARPAVAGAAPAVDLDWEASARSEQAATPGARRSGFVVRPDTRDI